MSKRDDDLFLDILEIQNRCVSVLKRLRLADDGESQRRNHDYERNPFRIAPYHGRYRPHLKFEVTSRPNGLRERRYFENLSQAKAYVESKCIELFNQSGH
jgi:hypothetical protein